MQTRPARNLFIATRSCGHAPSPVGRQPAETANERSEYLRASARRGCGPRSSDELHFFVSRRRRNVCFMNIIFHSIHPRQPGPRQKRFRTKGGRGDGAKNRRLFDVKRWHNRLRCQSSPAARWHDATCCSPSGLRGPQPLPRGGPQSFANAHSLPPQAAARTTAAAEDKFYPRSSACGSSEPRSSPPPHRGGLLSHSDRRRRTAGRGPNSA